MKLKVVLTTMKDGRVRLSAKHVPADPNDPPMEATYKSMEDALDQIDWMAARGTYAGRLGPDYFIAVTTELRKEV